MESSAEEEPSAIEDSAATEAEVNAVVDEASAEKAVVEEAVVEESVIEEPVVEDSVIEEPEIEEVPATEEAPAKPSRPVRASNDPREVKRREREAALRAQGVSIASGSTRQDKTEGSSSSST
jgi:ribonuclease E